MTNRSNKPRVSIGLPVYNGERYIAETLDSLIAQTFRDFELNICDNASTDRTEKICRSYAHRDGRIRYFCNESNLGAARNYRRVFELSVGEYFRWANCDDLFAPESLDRCVKILDQEPSVVLVYPKTKFIDEEGRVTSEYDDQLHLQSPQASERFVQLLQRLKYVNAIYGLVRADVLRKTGLIRNFIGGDIPLMAELTLYGKFWEIQEFLFYRRFHQEASSSYKDIAQLQDFFDTKRKGKIPFTRWKHLGAHFFSVMRSPASISDKMRLVYYLVRMGIWSRCELTQELYTAIQHVIREFFHIVDLHGEMGSKRRKLI